MPVSGRGRGSTNRVATRPALWAGVLALLALCFVADVLTPLGFLLPAVYIFIPLAAWPLQRHREVPLLATAITASVVLAFFLKPPGASPVMGAVNRALAIAAIWAVAALVTKVKRTQSETRESEERLHAIVDHAVDAIITIDEQGVVQSCNTAMTKLFGYAADEVVGRNVSMLMPSPYREAHDTYMHNYVTTGRKKIIGIGREVVARRKDGSIFPMDLSVSEFWIKGTRYFTGLVHDVSDRKRAEAALARANRSLAEKNRELQNIVYVTSHDLRSPLVNIQGFGKELEIACARVRELALSGPRDAAVERELEHALARDIPEALHFILGSATKMDALLRGLLRLSRLGRAALVFERLDMNGLVANVARSVEFQVQAAGARIELEDLPPCTGDATQVTQVFSNLVDNALKYRDESRPLVIRIRGERQADRSVYMVEDNGIGIAPAHQDRVFEIFHRLDLSRGEGEGLGLTIAQRIVERHNGSITLRSEPGRGSTFVVSLPSETAQEETAA